MLDIYKDFLDLLNISSKISGYIIFLIFPGLIFCIWTTPYVTEVATYFSIQSSITVIKYLITFGLLSLAILSILIIEGFRFRVPITIIRIGKYKDELGEIQKEESSVKKNKKFCKLLKKIEREADLSPWQMLNFDKTAYNFNDQNDLNKACSILIDIIERCIESIGARYIQKK